MAKGKIFMGRPISELKKESMKQNPFKERMVITYSITKKKPDIKLYVGSQQSVIILSKGDVKKLIQMIVPMARDLRIKTGYTYEEWVELGESITK